MPFVTEAIYQKLPNKDADSIMISTWPSKHYAIDTKSIKDFNFIQTLITRVRNVRNEYHVAPTKPIDIILEVEKTTASLLNSEIEILKAFMSPEKLEILNEVKINEETLSYVLSNCTLYIPLGSLVDFKEELNKQIAEEARLIQEIKRCEGMLSNTRFIEKAPEFKINQEREKRDNYETQLKKVRARIKDLRNHV